MKHIKKYPQAVDGMRVHEKANASYGTVETSATIEANLNIARAITELAELLEAQWADVCQTVSAAGVHLWSMVEEWVSHVDVTQCLARVSKERGFQCPELFAAEGAAVEIQQLRHPLVEASATRSTYVKHNVTLGQGATGWLVYGMNASGKSTLMKATGLCILLAQAGCFVPAQSMRICPFRAVYTRILNQDNLFAGLSSFAVEMSELRDILQGADKNSLVLGDELCAGTESLSAQALVLSGIHMLTQRGAKFIFATHLHGLANAVMKGVEVWHLHVEYDPVTQKLVYDRSLRRGQGSTLYGLEVARAMGLPSDFIEQALAYRHQMAGSVTQENAPTSAWSRDVQRRECEMCHAVTNVRELEVHHIQERATATAAGILPDGTHMNEKRNLITLCEKCHDLVHAGQLDIPPMVDTSDGPQRIVPGESAMQEQSAPVKRGKWTAEQMKEITDTLGKYPNMAMKVIRGLLQQRANISISEGTLRAIKMEM
jgi:DNA mismatch repair protein MutS